MRYFIPFLMVFLIPFVSYSSEDKVIIVRSDNWCPYNCDHKSDKPGFAVEILKTIFEPLGYKIDYQLMTWSRAYEKAKKGEVHVLIGLVKEDATHFYLPQNGVGQSNDCFFKLTKDPWVYQTTSSLKGKRIGIIQDYEYDPELMTFLEIHKDKIQALTGEHVIARQIKKLKTHKIDVFVEDENIFNYYKATEKGAEDVVNGGCNTFEPVYLGFAKAFKGSKNLMDIFDKGYIQIKNDGKLKEIHKKYSIIEKKSP